MVNGIDNKTTIAPKYCKRTWLLNFEARYTPLTAILKTIELPMKRMSLSLCKLIGLELSSFFIHITSSSLNKLLAIENKKFCNFLLSKPTVNVEVDLIIVYRHV